MTLLTLQAAFSAVTLSGEQLLLLVFTQLMPAPAAPAPLTAANNPAAGGGSGQAVVQLYIRSSAPEVTHAVQLNASDWLQDLAGGTVLPGLAQPGLHATGAPKPSIHPRVAATQGSFQAASSDSSLFSAAGISTPMSSKVGHAWLRTAALDEWQRLVSLP